MRPVRLQIAGLRSWTTERELRFENVDLAAVVGPTGAGKSSILEGIVYALYNTSTYEKRAGSLISSDVKTMSVTLDFDADGEQWRVTRAMSRGSYPPSVHKLACLTNASEHPMEEGEQAVNAAIQRLIGLDREQFLTAVLLPQGRFQTLLMATPSVRSAILKGVFRLDELDELRERAGRVRREEVEPLLETTRQERSLLLPDPEAALMQATADIETCTTKLDLLTEIKGRYDEIVDRATTLRREATAQRDSATSIQTAADGTPLLEDMLELDVELSQEEAGLRDLRDAQIAQRTGNQTQLDSAAAAGVTIETLAAARHVLDSATKSLPKLDADAVSLKAAFDSLSVDQTELASARERVATRRAKLITSEGAVSALKDAADNAHAALTSATDKLRVTRVASAQRETALAQLTEIETELKTAQDVAALANDEATVAKAAAEGAQGVFEAARSAHEAAHLAAGLKPGESCPVCQRELPSDFTAPKPPTVLGSAEAEAKRLHAVHEDARDAATKAAGRVETLTQRVATARLAVATAGRQEADALAAAAGYFTGLDLSRSDTELLASHADAATAAAAACEAAAEDFAARTAQIAAEEAAIAERSRSIEQRHAQLEKEETRIKTERRAISTSLKALPADYQSTSSSMNDLEETGLRCAGRLTELQQLEKAVRDGTEEIEKIDERIAAVQKRRTEKIDSPRRDATSHARDLAQKLREAKQTLKLPRQPADTAALAAHAGWVAEVVQVARAAAKDLEANAVGAEKSADEAAKAAEEILKAATEAAERELSTAAEFQRELDSRRASLLAAERARDVAAEQIPNAARLDDSIARLGRRRDALDELATCLGDGHFIKWLVERRQQLLLAVASEILADMTGDRYRFAADFTIVDGRTGVGRQPSTLSGGESFMASLSLALAMAEIAARGGGRIGSLYLDEGFGTLDPNSLDEAVTALELRARAGQMILIVSHLPAIAQRIDRVLQVRPDPTGATPEWLDDYDRESLLLDAASEVVS